MQKATKTKPLRTRTDRFVYSRDPVSERFQQVDPEFCDRWTNYLCELADDRARHGFRHKQPNRMERLRNDALLEVCGWFGMIAEVLTMRDLEKMEEKMREIARIPERPEGEAWILVNQALYRLDKEEKIEMMEAVRAVYQRSKGSCIE